MRPSINCLTIIKKFEGLYLKAYKCPAAVITIGYGSTMYSNGLRIKMGDIITKDQAEELLIWEVQKKTIALSGLNLNQNQVDAIMSFVFNVGYGAFTKSTMRKKIIVNPNDSTIKAEFMKWNKATVNGKLTVLKGLTTRRAAEADLYFKDIV